MKIIAFEAENVKRITVVKIEPNGNMVIIGGENGHGKSSVLDSIWWALDGASNIQSDPVRHGARDAKIKLDLGEYVVTRTFKVHDDKPRTTQITLTNKKGHKLSGAQGILNDFLGKLSFDPLEFSRMPSSEQFNMLRGFVSGVDFDAIDQADQEDYDRRTEVNRAARQAKAAADGITVPEGVPDQEIDEAAITQELANAGRQSAALLRQQRARIGRENDLAGLKTQRTSILESLPKLKQAEEDQYDRLIKQTDDKIAELRSHITLLEKTKSDMGHALEQKLTALSEKAVSDEENLTEKITKLTAELDAESVPESGPDIEAIESRLADAKKINALVRLKTAKSSKAADAERLEKESDEITAGMRLREQNKNDAIAASEMPIPGLGLGKNLVTLNGVPFDQASDAERLRASVAIAMASNPELRVVRIRDGSLLDENGMRLLAEMADKADCQVWVERVGRGDTGAFILEDGHIADPAK